MKRLLLDNFEQIISVAPLLTELLEACASLRMLVTSREALRLRGEHKFPLAPPELSKQGLLPEGTSIETLMQYQGTRAALISMAPPACTNHYSIASDGKSILCPDRLLELLR